MQRLGLNADEFRAYVQTLSRTHERRVTIVVTDLDGKRPRTLEPMILDGQVTVDARAQAPQPTRILTLTFLDPSRSLDFEPEADADAPIHRSRMVQVTYSVKVPELDRWVDCEVFTGPIHDFDRTGAVVSLVAHGKEVQAMGARWEQRGWPPKTRKTRIIRQLLEDTGETVLRVPDLPATTPAKVTVMRLDMPWTVAKRLGRSMNRQLYYNGAGAAILRPVPQRPVFTFGPEWLLSDVSVDRDPEGMHNVFRVVGAVPKGSKKRVASTLFLNPGHPNSSQSLARNGKPLRLVNEERNDQFKTRADCRRRATQLRDDAMRAAVDVSVDVLPVPFLDERDLVRVTDGSGSHVLRLDRWVLPLGVEGAPAMTLGAITKAGDKGGRRKARRRNDKARRGNR